MQQASYPCDCAALIPAAAVWTFAQTTWLIRPTNHRSRPLPEIATNDSTGDLAICPLGIDGVLVRFSRALSQQANDAAHAFCDAVIDARLSGVTEVAP